jgi:hypothetical protein
VGNVWDPCAHAFYVILYHGGKSGDYVDNYYSLEMYKKAYDPIIYTVPNEEQWLKTMHDILEPLKSKLTIGRPRKALVKTSDESRDTKNPYRMRKFGLKRKCTKCKLMGCNSRTCPKRKQEASNYRKLATEIDLPTLPPASASFTKPYTCIIVDVLSLYVIYLHFILFAVLVIWALDTKCWM